MGNTVSDDESTEIVRKAIIPFRVRNNGFQVDYKIFKFRNFTKAKVDEATDTKYDDSFLELNTRSKIVGDIRKVLTISAESICDEYATLRKNYYSRILFGILTFFIGLVLTNIGLVQNELPKGRIMIIFGGLLLLLTLITVIIIIYTDRRLKHLNKEFVGNCVKILEKEKIVTWTASFQHLLFDIIYPYNGKSGVGAVILTPNPYFEMISKTTDDVIDCDIHVNDDDKKTSKLKLPVPQWAIDESISEGPYNEEQPLIKQGKKHHHHHRDKSLIYPPSDDENQGDEKLKDIISANEVSSEDDDDDDDEAAKHSDLLPPSDADNEQESDLNVNQQAGQADNASVRKSPPKAYTGFDDVSKENVAKIHGDLIQRFFHENPEDIEGHGEDTALIENLPLNDNVAEYALNP
eukprot:CAMPEP_0197023048 /NCGR_PEP_ID=MMETSP1384-20130603/3830_1 /TAXON_ID=29189 /ORGANISM="Ammonia sp." /LENGTH=406 /DNA_ID=CAMNT_0042451197 /DNA_START=165 /DNA_END=1385 /DNA_ORIENTATION=+